MAGSTFARSARRLFVATAAASSGVYAYILSEPSYVPVTAQDPIFSSATYLRNNPNRNPETKDLFVKTVPISAINPSLLEKEGRLVEAFCAGVWGGGAYNIQRLYLSRKYQNEDTKDQLWSKQELQNSTYPVGTIITDHFEVVSKTPESIVVRCGDSPRIQDVRDSDGLFEMSAVVKRDQGVVEFGLKSVFYKGLGLAAGPPMPSHIEFLHQLYSRQLLQSAISHVRKSR